MYDYKWNAEAGERDFWEDAGKGWNEIIPWHKWCPSGYERDTWKWWKAKCVIPPSARFLGEACSDKGQCDNSFVRGLIDVTCAPTNNDSADPRWKCVFDEEANTVSPYASTCSCAGLIWCASEDCGGSQCVLSTMDMKKHCKYADEPLFRWDQILGGKSSCSNCRASEDSCEAYGGGSKYGDTNAESVAAAAGGGAISAASVLGLGYMGFQRRKMKKLEGRAERLELELEKGVGGKGVV